MDIHCFKELKRGSMYETLKQYFPEAAKGKSRARRDDLVETYEREHKEWTRRHFNTTTQQQAAESLSSTGRLSIREPNHQKPPLRTEEGKALAEAVHAKEREEFEALMEDVPPTDYAMVELRVFSAIQQKYGEVDNLTPEELYAHYGTDDIYVIVAHHAYNVPVDEVTSEMRHSVKTATFWERYSKNPAEPPAGIPHEEYASIRARLREMFPDAFRLMRSDIEAAKERMATSRVEHVHTPPAEEPKPAEDEHIGLGRRDEIEAALMNLRAKHLRLIDEWRRIPPINRHMKRRRDKIAQKIRKVLPKGITLSEAAQVV